MKSWLAVLAFSFLCACGNYGLSNIDKPAPRTDEGWLMANGASLPLLEVRRALLECGAPSPEMNSFVFKQALGIADFDNEMNHYFLVKRCMEASGLRDSARSLSQSCEDKAFPERRGYPACQPGAVFPTRSVERRLNSWYCKIKTDREYCRKHAFTPSACDDPKKDYNNPPPECLP